MLDSLAYKVACFLRSRAVAKAFAFGVLPSFVAISAVGCLLVQPSPQVVAFLVGLSISLITYFYFLTKVDSYLQ